MDFGSLDGLVNATEKVVYDSGELAAAVTSLTITGLDGDVDEEYTLYARIVNGYNGSVNYALTMNTDTGANYGRQILYGTDTTVASARDVGNGFILFAAVALANICMTDLKLYAKSGQVRTAILKSIDAVSGTTVNEVDLIGRSWNNSVDNITQMVLTASQASGIGIGSRIILMKKVTATTGMRTGVMNVGQPLVNATVNRSCVLKGMWQTIYKNTLAAAATSVTISGLDGDTDVMYRLKVRQINGYNGAINTFLYIHNDTTATNYGYQNLSGEDTAVAAARATNTPRIISGIQAQNQMSDVDILLYAKSGYVRTFINETVMDLVTTTVRAIELQGQVWNNTATNITSLVLATAPSRADAFGIGSIVELERLNL